MFVLHSTYSDSLPIHAVQGVLTASLSRPHTLSYVHSRSQRQRARARATAAAAAGRPRAVSRRRCRSSQCRELVLLALTAALTALSLSPARLQSLPPPATTRCL